MAIQQYKDILLLQLLRHYVCPSLSQPSDKGGSDTYGDLRDAFMAVLQHFLKRTSLLG